MYILVYVTFDGSLYCIHNSYIESYNISLLYFYSDPCNECVINSTCDPQSDGSVNCVCPAGYNGTSCNNYINMCNPNPCMNGGSCKNLINDYICQCAPGYIRRNCSSEGIVAYVCIVD